MKDLNLTIIMIIFYKIFNAVINATRRQFQEAQD